MEHNKKCYSFNMYSLDFRKKIFAIKEKETLTFEETSKQFHTGIATLFRWQQRIDPITKRNVLSRKIDRKDLEKDVHDNPDSYQWERAKKFKVTAWGIGKALRR